MHVVIRQNLLAPVHSSRGLEDPLQAGLFLMASTHDGLCFTRDCVQECSEVRCEKAESTRVTGHI